MGGLPYYAFLVSSWGVKTRFFWEVCRVICGHGLLVIVPGGKARHLWQERPFVEAFPYDFSADCGHLYCNHAGGRLLASLERCLCRRHFRWIFWLSISMIGGWRSGGMFSPSTLSFNIVKDRRLKVTWSILPFNIVSVTWFMRCIWP